MDNQPVSARLTPDGSMEVLSRYEVNLIKNKHNTPLYELFRRCSLAVLNSGVMSDDSAALMAAHNAFNINVVQQPRGVKLNIENAPPSAFVDGEIIQGIKEHLFSVLRDIVYTNSVLKRDKTFDLNQSRDITNFIFHLLRNANLFESDRHTDIVVCWGGHSISRTEYDYTKEVGYQLGLRRLNICTGCGPGAMKGPMKGAAVAHAKQRIHKGRYIGVTEPGIIAAESPNPIVNELTILPDIEKRLEAFVRLGHGIIVFPGGVGTAEEILYLLGILLHPKNEKIPFPLIFSGPESSSDYFKMIDEFIGSTLGAEAQKRYDIVLGDPEKTAIMMKSKLEDVFSYRRKHRDAFFYNWLLKIDPVFQVPFAPTHDNMHRLNLSLDRPKHELAADLRRAFSGIVAGNVKDEGLRAVASDGPFIMTGDRVLMDRLDQLLKAFVKAGRMKLPGSRYEPCYVLK